MNTVIASHLYHSALLLRQRHIQEISDELKSLPDVFIGQRRRNGRTIDVARIYVDRGTARKQRKQIDLDTAGGKVLLQKKKRKDELLKALSELPYKDQLDLSGISGTATAAPGKRSFNFSKEAFDQLVEKRDDNLTKAYPFDGHVFRSKSELLTAQMLKAFGLEYKYEVILTIGEHTYYIDFAVFCPETGRFFFIEHFGMMNDNAYRLRALEKIGVYDQYGLQEGLDILYIYENWNKGFFTDVTKGKILGIIITQIMMSQPRQ